MCVWYVHFKYHPSISYMYIHTYIHTNNDLSFYVLYFYDIHLYPHTAITPTTENAEGVIIGISIGAVGIIAFLGVFGFIWFKRYGRYMGMFGNRKTEIADSVDNPMFFDPTAGEDEGDDDHFDVDTYRKRNAGECLSLGLG